MTTPLVDRLAARGAAAECGPDPGDRTPDVVRLVAALRRAVALRDAPDEALSAWDEAGALHDPESLDEALGALTPGIGMPFVSGLRRRRLRDAARRALRTTTRPGTLRLVAAVLGAVGKREDASLLETVAVHPAFTLHGATALANLDHWEGRAGLLRLLSQVQGEERVLVIDRLLPFVREPAVRLALVRDAFVDLPDELARQVAPAVAETLGLDAWIDEERAPPELRDAARRILDLAGSASG